MASKINPKTGIPYGVSTNNWNKGAYIITPSGNAKYVGAQPDKRTASQKVFATPEKDGSMNANSALRNKQAMETDQLKLDRRYDQAQTLRDFNVAQANWNDNERRKKETIPGYQPQPFSNSPEYTDNRIKASNINATYSTDRDALNTAQQQAWIDKSAQDYANMLKKIEARTLFFGGNSELAQQNVLADRRRQALASGQDPNAIDTSMPTLNAEYLKSIGLLSSVLDANGNPSIYGMGSSNYNPTSGTFNISQAERKQLKTDRADLAAGKYDDRIAKGDFSASGTGIIGYDGKALPNETVTYGGNIYQGDPLSGFNYVSPIKAPALNTGSSSSDISSYQDMMNQFTAALQAMQQQGQAAATPTNASAESGPNYSVGPSVIGVSGNPTLASAKSSGTKATTKTVGGSTKYTVPSQTSVRLV